MMNLMMVWQRCIDLYGKYCVTFKYQGDQILLIKTIFEFVDFKGQIVRNRVFWRQSWRIRKFWEATISRIIL